jgi:dinuclear metal center YbgI/SA1388 family protein
MPGPTSLATITAYLDEYLRIKEVPDDPNAVNGLQVENRSGQIERIVAAVDGTMATIAGTSTPRTLILVHHGLFWDGNLPVTGRRYRRLSALLEHDIALYSAHIPLDAHPEVGNNHVLARALGLTAIESFDTYRGAPVGVQGVLDPALLRQALVERVVKHIGGTARLIAGGPELCRRIGIITGGAGGRLGNAAAAGLDTYITGEGAHHTYFDAMEFGVNAIYAGHYATETVGVKALAEHLSAKYGIPWEFHDHPTGL